MSLPKYRLKTAFVHKAKRLDRVFAPELTIATTPISSADIDETYSIGNYLPFLQVRLVAPKIETKKVKDIKRSIYLAMLYADYPSE